MIDLVKYPVLTQKSTSLLERNQYTFEVDKRLTKPEIKFILEDLFNVKILALNTHILPSKKRRLGRFVGNKTNYKRVVVTLQSDSFFPLFSNS